MKLFTLTLSDDGAEVTVHHPDTGDILGRAYVHSDLDGDVSVINAARDALGSTGATEQAGRCAARAAEPAPEGFTVAQARAVSLNGIATTGGGKSAAVTAAVAEGLAAGHEVAVVDVGNRRGEVGLPRRDGSYAVQGLPYPVADYRQPLTDRERELGVTVAGACEVDSTGWCAIHRQTEA